MDKILYFRSSADPLILDEGQRETRRKGILRSQNINQLIRLSFSIEARIEALKKGAGIMIIRGQTLPELTSSNRMDHGNCRNDLSR